MVRKLAFNGLILISTALFAYGQSAPAPDPTPTPYSGRRETGVEKTRRLDGAQSRIEQQLYSNLYGQGAYAKSPRFSPEFRAAMVSLYRKPGKSDLEPLEPQEEFRRQYADFLKKEKTGLFKLIPDPGCETDGRVVSASPDCVRINIPGAGSSYSFRLNTYRIRRLADLTLVKNSLIARGVLSGAIFVELGDIAIESISLKTPGVGFLSHYTPVKKTDEALVEAKRFAKGVKKDGFIYGRGVFATAGSTFAMRSIAYRGTYLRSQSGVTYNELDFDRRRDIIVAFRIIDVDDKGAATIVSKILRDLKSPRLKTIRGKTN